MDQQRTPDSAVHPAAQRGGWNQQSVIGIALIVIGVLAFLVTLVRAQDLGLFVLPALSIMLLAWGSLIRSGVLVVTGAILAGIGVGLVLAERAFTGLSDTAGAGLIVLFTGLGVLLVMPLLFVTTRRWERWPLLPGGILALLGAALLFGGMLRSAVELVGRLWPLALVALGLSLLWQGYRNRSKR
ncbi:MAG: hypothetical protein ACM3N4_10400 [Nitrososphaerota archaeon]